MKNLKNHIICSSIVEMNIVHYADMLAIPFFLVLTIYLFNKKRTFIENLLLLFAVSGLVLDVYFSYNFINNNYDTR